MGRNPKKKSEYLIIWTWTITAGAWFNRKEGILSFMELLLLCSATRIWRERTSSRPEGNARFGFLLVVAKNARSLRGPLGFGPIQLFDGLVFFSWIGWCGDSKLSGE